MFNRHISVGAVNIKMNRVSQDLPENTNQSQNIQ